ncbi:MAG TPA: hypothetical protein VF516_08125, partial [Kofleriaceae bacterium]
PVATPVQPPPTPLPSTQQPTDSKALSESDPIGLDFEAVDDAPEADDPEDLDAEPDAEADFDADA